jgi:predicted transcriptional regulator
MTGLDDRILEMLDSSGLVLSPSIIAYNLDRSREGVAKRIRKLERHGLIHRETRGKYRITEEGTAYLNGELDVSSLDPDD